MRHSINSDGSIPHEPADDVADPEYFRMVLARMNQMAIAHKVTRTEVVVMFGLAGKGVRPNYEIAARTVNDFETAIYLGVNHELDQVNTMTRNFTFGRARSFDEVMRVMRGLIENAD